MESLIIGEILLTQFTPNFINRVNEIPRGIPTTYIIGTDKLIIKLTWECKRLEGVKNNTIKPEGSSCWLHVYCPARAIKPWCIAGVDCCSDEHCGVFQNRNCQLVLQQRPLSQTKQRVQEMVLAQWMITCHTRNWATGMTPFVTINPKWISHIKVIIKPYRSKQNLKNQSSIGFINTKSFR